VHEFQVPGNKGNKRQMSKFGKNRMVASESTPTLRNSDSNRTLNQSASAATVRFEESANTTNTYQNPFEREVPRFGGDPNELANDMAHDNSKLLQVRAERETARAKRSGAKRSGASATKNIYAVLRCAHRRCAHLRCAHLRCAHLRCAHLRCARLCASDFAAAVEFHLAIALPHHLVNPPTPICSLLQALTELGIDHESIERALINAKKDRILAAREAAHEKKARLKLDATIEELEGKLKDAEEKLAAMEEEMGDR
jgi:hypothetical protein